ncbi:geranylgeranyl reductase family protein [Microaerobacter geothermalis]|uniref:NAD(P)/FAD-dependent oxidoreductase n=1 Tax=Microaerobacter geothermalis TaxID=674972 RepID=UPI001F3683F3|nr:geranylgeranyl reductase family protein [Microaerobacter geothermalis]MCF6094717.1 geranylgeranyl reductase family protein [Microaerobacter geothermalis]
MNRHIFDVIIVGAGPGGSCLAAKLAQGGYDVLLLEKCSLPRYKVCGGGITKRAFNKMPIDISSVIRDEVDTFEVELNGENQRVFRHGNPFVFSVMRDELDYLLVNYAISCGADLKTGAFVKDVVEHEDKVIVTTRDQVYEARYVVGADGVNSLVAKQVGLMAQRRKASALEYEIQVDDLELEKYKGRIVIDYGIIPYGYAWIFPKKNHLSVGIGSYTFAHQEMPKLLMKFMSRRQLSGKFLSAKGSFLSAGGVQQPIMTNRVALIGDAAGLVEAFAGEGIYYAIWSGELLYERLKESLDGNAEAFLRYQLDVDAQILAELKIIERMAHLFYQNTRMAHQVITRFPQLMTFGFEVLEGTVSYKAMYQRLKDQMSISGVMKKVKGYFSQ